VEDGIETREGIERMTRVEWTHLTWPEAATLAARNDTVGLIGVGALEQHGPHLPMIMDCVHAEALIHTVADRFREPVIVAPMLAGGLSDHHVAFPGTVTLPVPVFRGVLEAYIAGMERINVHRIAIVSGHGGNFTAIGELADAYCKDHPSTDVIAYNSLQGFIDVMFKAARQVGTEPVSTDIHAGVLETSIALHLFEPGDVKDFSTVTGYTSAEPGWLDKLTTQGVQALSESGVLGRPQGATADIGQTVFMALVAEIVRWIGGRFDLQPADTAEAVN